MWMMLIAVTATFLLFFYRVSFPLKTSTTSTAFSIIIPARNEEENLTRLLPSILHEGDHLEVIVVDDNSEDRTCEIAEGFGVKVISTPPLPEGWLGKPWACYNGAKEATGEFFCFLDADTWFENHGVKRLGSYVETMESNELVTIHPYHCMRSFREKLSLLFHLVVFASTGITSVFRDFLGTKGGFGACMVIPEKTYWELGGHYAVKHEIVEHLTFCRKAESRGVTIHAFSGKNLLNMRMYPAGLGAIIEGWSKSMASGAKSASPFMLILTITWLSTVISFLVQLPSMNWKFAAGFLLIAFFLYRFLQDVGNVRWYDALLFPVHVFFFVGLFVYSLMRNLSGKSTWKGRKIVARKKRSSS
ncbi:glycosyltransferase [Halobacillus salinarum]|uniref:4,4'-diaponeurosporenoate glycosyltransferase n=1 Tax=Halobacillus salinarum TaxID=2932257 RepID=A0ABY4EK43_9BACI|nr:glycosyltransferase family 2 protein [Halobacillus salinarum]UOQ44412.1 glycosyltransferase [Halobacillus salinarum]